MIKKIAIQQLQPGMYIHDLNCDWMAHPFLRNRFLVSKTADIKKISDAGVREVYIDTKRGSDVLDAPTEHEVKVAVHQEMLDVASEPRSTQVRRTAAEEMTRAQQIYEKTTDTVRNVMRDARMGKAVELAGVDAVVEDIATSVSRNSGALVSLVRMREMDNYTFHHCVAVGTLMITFAQALELDAETVHQAGIGGLLHDIGKIKIPERILKKPGKLTDEEYEIAKRHPIDGYNMLLESGVVGPIPLDITRHHHERVDGSGYPDGLPRERISLLAKMAAIVDVYDALTSKRVYHNAIEPTEALRKLFEWTKHHFEANLVHQFMRAIGIYPVGTLVRLESARLAVVVEQNEESLLMPKVKVCFSTKSNCYVVPELIDLSSWQSGGDKIVNHEMPEKWGIDPLQFI